MVKVPVITIDGPSGSGKGTVARILAQMLGWHVLDSGALYRLLALAADWHHVPVEEEALIADLAKHLDCTFVINGQTEILLEAKKVTEELRSELVGNTASKIAVYPAVREHLLARQRAFATMPGLVADGRDMGTVVFQDAFLKFYLDASVQARAQRRCLELQQRGIDASLDSLCLEIGKRDKRDKERVIAPLRPAEDAILLDSTELSALQIAWQMVSILQECKPDFIKDREIKKGGEVLPGFTVD